MNATSELSPHIAAQFGRASSAFGVLAVLLRFRATAVKNQIRNIKQESMLKTVVVGTLGIVFWIGLFAMFLYFFQFLHKHTSIFYSFLVPRILSLFFMAVAFMLVFSNAVISFSNLFRSTETQFLFSLPLRHDAIYLYKLVESLVFSSWAVFALGLPLLLAYGIISDAVWYFYPAIIVFMIPFVLLPAGVGGLLGMILTAIVPRHLGTIFAIAIIGSLALALYVCITVLRAQSGMPHQDIDASVRVVLSKLSFTQHYMTPNFWITDGLVSLCSGSRGALLSSTLYLGALSASALFSVTLGWFLSGSMYEKTFSLASGSGSETRKARRGYLETLLAPLQMRYPHIFILLLKDIKTFLRDPSQWSQVLIFFGILVLYIGNLRNFSYPLNEPFYQNLIAFLNLGATAMTLATVTSRFVFPLISLEGRRFWVLGLVPLRRRDIMMSKFYFSFGGTAVLCTALILLSNLILGNSAFVMRVQLITGVMISLGLSGLCVGMGALFPNFEERNPSKIVSGFGGTLTLICAIVLVLFTISAEGLLCHSYLVKPGEEGLIGQFWATVLIGLLLLMNFLAAFVPMHYGIRTLERSEF